MATQPAPDKETLREQYYRKIDRQHMTPLWEVLDDLVTPEPATRCVPHLWRFEDVKPFLTESGTLISAKEAVRRVLILENPGLRGASSITQSLYAGLQLILPGETAPAHRHTQSALRFVVEGSGAYTAVNGERHTMAPGDFIITPSWTWHDHGNPASEPVIWLDGLDIPIVRSLDASFAENFPEDEQPVTSLEGKSSTRFGNNMVPADYEPTSLTSPIFAYPYTQSRTTLRELAERTDPDLAHGYKMQFINPVTGGYAMPTIAAFMQLLPANFESTRYRSTDGTVYSVVEGSGAVTIGEGQGASTFEFVSKDHFVIPAWHPHQFRITDECVLFSFSDRPVQKAFGMWREQRL